MNSFLIRLFFVCLFYLFSRKRCAYITECNLGGTHIVFMIMKMELPEFDHSFIKINCFPYFPLNKLITVHLSSATEPFKCCEIKMNMKGSL